MNSIAARLAFCVSARTGLGHLRRTANIARALKRKAPHVELVLISNRSVAGLADEEIAQFTSLHLAEREAMARVAIGLAVDAIAVDTAVLSGLEMAPQPLALVLRETVADRLPMFRLRAGRLWDEVIVAEPADRWRVDATEVGARNVTNVGWIYRSPRSCPGLLSRRPGERILLIATGGGGGDKAGGVNIGDIEAIVAATRRLCPFPLRVLQVLGPLAPTNARIRNTDGLVEVGSRLDEAFATADAIISTAGYNSVLEIAATDTPALLCTIPRTYDDQHARTLAWADALGSSHEPGRTRQSAQWLAKSLASGERRPKAMSEASGCVLAADALLDLIDRKQTIGVGGRFVKAFAEMGASQAAVQRSNAFYEAGVRTPPARHDGAGRLANFPWLDGPTAFELWQEQRGNPTGLRSLIDVVVRPLIGLHHSTVASLEREPLDIWKRVTPRFALGSQAAARLESSALAALRSTMKKLSSLYAPLSESAIRPVIVHGDFHLGQLVHPVAAEEMVLLDLDDIAAGPAEADLGNCVAHIVTSPALSEAPLASEFSRLSSLFAEAYVMAGGARPDMRLVNLLGAAALIRRAMKLAENGRTAPSITSILSAIQSLTELATEAHGTGARIFAQDRASAEEAR